MKESAAAFSIGRAQRGNLIYLKPNILDQNSESKKYIPGPGSYEKSNVTFDGAKQSPGWM